MYVDHFRQMLVEEKRQLQRQIELYESDEAIAKMKDVCDRRVRSAEEKLATEHNRWMACLDTNKELKKRNSVLYNENTTMRAKISRLERKCGNLEQQYERLEEQHQKQTFEKMDLEDEINALKAKIVEQEQEIERLTKMKAHDGTMVGMPTGSTPPDKKKVIPNTRNKSNRSKGGQPGREKRSLTAFDEDEVMETVEHATDVCPDCGGPIERMEKNEIIKDESDYEVKVIKRRHRFPTYRCKKCGKVFHVKIPENLKEENQYGPVMQAIILALLDLGFVSIGRTREIVTGMGKGILTPSEGYVGKIQKKAARKLKGFCEDVRKWCLDQRVLFWDDTVIFMNTHRACFRFYGNERAAYYVAHEKKDLNGVIEDGILNCLGENTYLMHDHVSMNYREEFEFQNIECVQHLERDLEKNTNDSDHKWSLKLKKLLSSWIHKRKEEIEKGKAGFSEREIHKFEEKYEKLIQLGEKENKSSKELFYYKQENTLLKRIKKYKKNYFAWIYDFSLPTTNNESERSLRMTKTKMKVSGQFQKEETASEFAAIRTYTETCKRNGISVFDAMQRLMEGNPYRLDEIMS